MNRFFIPKAIIIIFALCVLALASIAGYLIQKNKLEENQTIVENNEIVCIMNDVPYPIASCKGDY